MTDYQETGIVYNVDDRPLMAEICEVVKLNSKFSDYYFNVVGNDGSTYYGGNQGWWMDKVTTSKIRLKGC